MFVPCADSQMLLTACDDMHTHLYDVEHASLIEAFSGEQQQKLMHTYGCMSCTRDLRMPCQVREKFLASLVDVPVMKETAVKG